MKASEILRNAKSKLEDVGWAQNRVLSRDEDNHITGYCAGGAVLAACDGQPWTTPIGYLEKAAPEKFQRHFNLDGVFKYNDHPGRQFSTIQKWFDRAIELAEENERGQNETR